MTDIADQTNELFFAIGETVVLFQQVEQWLAEELALLLRMRDKDDQYLVSAAMSYKQKVDLLIALFPKRSHRLPVQSVGDVRKALYAAEDYRNRVVHSFYAIECGDELRWLRLKGSLKGRAGFSLNSNDANVQIFKECNSALRTIGQWSFAEPVLLRQATETLQKHLQAS